MSLSNKDKGWLLFKREDDLRYGGRSPIFIDENNAQSLNNLSAEGLLETKDSKEFYLTNKGKKEAINIFKSSSAGELDMMGKLIISPTSNSTWPDDSIFRIKITAQTN